MRATTRTVKVEPWRALPENAVVVVVSNDEILATEAWKRLMVTARPNVYILAGGLNLWLNIYGVSEEEVAGHAGTSLAQPNGRLRPRGPTRILLRSGNIPPRCGC